MNESPAAIETEIKLGAKVGANLTGYGTLYRVDGAQEKLYFENGKAKVTSPGRTLVGRKIASETVEAHGYAHREGKDRGGTIGLGNTVAEDGAGQGLVLHIAPSKDGKGTCRESECEEG